MNNNVEKIGISIVIPCYKAGRFLIEAVDSIEKQPFKYPYEIIIVDDGSPDLDTKECLNELNNRKNLSVIFLAHNCGAQVARNTGIRASNFDYIFMMDADDCLNLDLDILSQGTYTDRAIDILRTRENVAFVHGITLMFGDYNGVTSSAYPVTKSLILSKHHASTAIIYRKEDAFKAGLYDEAIEKWQDWSFAVALLNGRHKAAQNNEIEFLEAPYYLYRVHGQTQRISAKDIDEKEMIRRTVSRHPEIFEAQYPDHSHEEIVTRVYSKKPDRLKDLLYIASNNIALALNVVQQRGFDIVAKNELNNIP